MEVQTETEQTTKDRRGILEFLLINHPLDCPICDRGGECPLQNNTIFYGPPTTRFIEEKRHLPKAYALSEYVVFDRERCIHCARCTRFTTDISGDAQLDFLFRGADMKVSTFEDTTFKSRFSGNVIELCPVGALLSREYRFKARPWDLMTQKSICTQCSNGCNIKLDYRVGELQRVNARLNEDLNEEWTCDKGKFGMGYVSGDQRIKQPLIRKGNSFVPATWEEANDLIISELKKAGTAIGGIGGAHASNEDLYVWQKFFREHLGVNNIDHRMGPNFAPTKSGVFAQFGHHTMANSVAELETKNAILIFGSNLVEEQPIIFLRVRKAWRWKQAKVVEILPTNVMDDEFPNHVSEFANLSIRYQPGTEVALISGLINAVIASGASKVENSGLEPIASLLSTWTIDRAATETGVSAEKIKRAAELIAVEGMATIAGKFLTDHPQSASVLAALGNLAIITGNGENFNVPVTTNNQQGAMDLGVLPDSLPGYTAPQNVGLNTLEILNGATTGSIKMLWVMGADPVSEFYDRSVVEKAFEGAEFVVVHAHSMNATASMANVILPSQTVAEQDGSYTNVERRVQRFHKAFEISSDIHADWVIFQQIAAQMGKFMQFFSPRDISKEIVATVPIYANCGLRDLGEAGVRWEYPVESKFVPKIAATEYRSPVAV